MLGIYKAIDEPQGTAQPHQTRLNPDPANIRLAHSLRTM